MATNKSNKDDLLASRTKRETLFFLGFLIIGHTIGGLIIGYDNLLFQKSVGVEAKGLIGEILLFPFDHILLSLFGIVVLGNVLIGFLIIRKYYYSLKGIKSDFWFGRDENLN